MPVVFTAAAVLALVVVATAAAYAAFRTPGRAAYCGLSEGEPPVALMCWTPNDGFGVSMLAGGRAAKGFSRFNRGEYEDLAPLLRFGSRWRGLGFTCTSRVTGLTCVNRVGRGWWLGRFKGYRIF